MSRWEIDNILSSLSLGDSLAGISDSLLSGLSGISDAASAALPDPDSCQGQHLAQIAELQQERSAIQAEIDLLTGPMIGDQDPVQAQIDAANALILPQNWTSINSYEDFVASQSGLITEGINNLANVALLGEAIDTLNQEISNLAESSQSCEG